MHTAATSPAPAPGRASPWNRNVSVSTGRVLALDVGTRRVGVAVGGGLSVPQAVATVPAAALPQALAALLREWQPSALVLGLPLNAAGEDTAMSRRVRALARRLQQQYGLPVHLHDEYLSSHAAAREPAAGRAGRDAQAAALILAGWLQAQTRR